MDYLKFKEQLIEGAFDEVLKTLYGSCEQTVSRQKHRYSDAVDRFLHTLTNGGKI